MQTKNYYQTMKDGVKIKINKWTPDSDEKIKGIIVLHHGLAEHSMRYDRFGSILTENGYVLIAHDIRGHGATAELAQQEKTGSFGKLADKDGFYKAVEDLYEIILCAKTEYSETKVILMGHSFGSIISQGFIEKYSHAIDGCVLCGTTYMPQFVSHFGHALFCLVRTFKGKNKTSKFLRNIAFFGYNKRVSDSESPNAWVSKSKMNLEMYESDKWCGIPLTTSFFCDLVFALNQIGKNKNIKKIRKNLPVDFIYGSEDPVGNYGKSIQKLISLYKKFGIKNLQVKIYEGDRHEILNEDDKELVESDLINWFDNLTK